MAGRVLELEQVLTPDNLGCEIARMYQTWETFRNAKKEEWKELDKFLYATDTTTTSNAVLPWKNTTTTPKLTQIMDNLYANYMASMFPKRRWMDWEGADAANDTADKKKAIKAYMQYVIDYPGFKDTISALVLDYIQKGNCFAIPDWLDQRVEQDGKVQAGYVGPIARRLSPYDIVMNPTAPDFYRSPKIVRSLVSLGEVQEILQRITTDDGEKQTNNELFNYLNDIRGRATTFQGDIKEVDELYRVDGFTSFRAYLESGYAEILTFYGDLYDRESRKFYKNRLIQVVDRHKIIRNTPNPTDLGFPPIFHSGWRPRQDNLWAMGPLDNLVGLQYRLDHLENLKADYFDLVAFPPLKVKGYVEDFVWGPFEKIYVGDDGDVEVLGTTVNPLQANLELEAIKANMERLAGAPEQAMGIRSPGEKTKYEVQVLEQGAGRIFQAKISQFEEQILEPLLNSMLELARRKMSQTTVRVIDDEYNVAEFMTLTADDIAGQGRFRPIAARHFAEVAERVQDITAFYQSGIGADPEVRAHISSVEMAKLFEELLDLTEYHLVSPYIRLTEEAEAQRIASQHQEDTLMGMSTPSGLSPDDADQAFNPNSVNASGA